MIHNKHIGKKAYERINLREKWMCLPAIAVIMYLQRYLLLKNSINKKIYIYFQVYKCFGYCYTNNESAVILPDRKQEKKQMIELRELIKKRQVSDFSNVKWTPLDKSVLCLICTCWSTPTASSPSYIMSTQPSLEASTKRDIRAWRNTKQRQYS